MFSLVIPVYRNEDSVPDLVDMLETLNRDLGGELEVVLVVDGSPDRCFELLRDALPHVGFSSQLLVLSRNFGAFNAIRAGLAHASGELVAVTAADLQEPPELIVAFRKRLLAGDVDVVVGVREKRDDPLSQRVASALFWLFYRQFVQKQVPAGGVDVFACTRKFRDHLLALKERNSTLIGLVFWLGFRRALIRYRRRERRHGRSAWTAARRMRYLLDSTFAFSDLPMRLMSALGLLGVGLSVVLSAVVMIAKFYGKIQVSGYTATILVVMFFGGLNSLGLGLLGEYVWRTFENTKERPGYVVAQHHLYSKERDDA